MVWEGDLEFILEIFPSAAIPVGTFMQHLSRVSV